jgi:hypothetical protein
MTAELMGVTFSPVRMGDRRRTARGWLVVAEGALRGIMSAGPDGQVVHGFACDQRIAPGSDGVIVFQGLDEAYAWAEKRLLPLARRPASSRSPRVMEYEILPMPLTRAEAEQALIGAAMDYCWSIRHRSLPDDGPLRRLWIAHVNFRRVVRTGSLT